MGFLPAGLWGSSFPPRPFSFTNGLPPDDAYHLHPHYRSQRTLDAVLLKVPAGSDEFISEKYAEQIGAILAEWSMGLKQSPRDLRPIEQSLSANFRGLSLQSSATQSIRSGGPVEVQRFEFQSHLELGRDDFLSDLRMTLDGLSQIATAEFQITRIDVSGLIASSPASVAQVATSVRFEIVGSGKDFYREQRIGAWEIEWGLSVDSSFKVRNWRATEETRSHTKAPVFLDITAPALGGNASYSQQLLHGADYWRTVLDGASGIDIYGHNGVSVADIDNDGFDDLYVCQPAGLPNRLYRNRGDGTFEDITESSGLGILDNTACALFADFSNSGRQDVVVVRANGPLLFVNDGSGKFRHAPDAFHFANQPQGTFTGAAIADYDRDGWLDIYFCLYIYYQGTDQYKYPVPYYAAENGPPNFLLRNNRNGTFQDVTAAIGLDKNNTRYSFCCAWNDYNNDGWPDLYVVNDFGKKNLYRNNGNGTFTDVAAGAGVEDIGAGMGVCWADFDNTGSESLYVANMWTSAGERISTEKIFQERSDLQARSAYRKHAMGNSLFHNQAGKFKDATATSGAGMGRWSWASDVFDFDHDGFSDLYVTNGMISTTAGSDLNSFFWRQVVANSPGTARSSQPYEQAWAALNELIRSDSSWSGFERNVFYANNRDGTFSDVSGAAGMDFIEDGRSFAISDFDQDGRQEIFLKNRNAPQLRILRNVITDLPPAIAFRLRGTKSNRDAIGAIVTIETDSRRQTRTLQAGSGFLSQHSKEIFFGLGSSRQPAHATIRWPNGTTQEFRDLPHNHRIWIEEGTATPFRMEPFRAGAKIAETAEQTAEVFPPTVETWLLAPVSSPAFSLSDLSGKTRSLGEWKGHVVLLSLWSTASADYRSHLQALERAHSRISKTGAAVLGLHLAPGDDASSDPGLRDLHFSFPILRGTEDVAGVYNLLYRSLFDRHRDLALPASFLINAKGEVVKLYQGPLRPERVEADARGIPQSDTERLTKALPFPGVSKTYEFGRNNLSFGSVFFQRGYLDQAAEAFRLALNDDPQSAEALYGIGSVLLNQNKNAEARQYFERTLKMRAGYPQTIPNAWNNLGLLAARETRTDDAISNFVEALKLSPDHSIALVNLGNAYRQQKNWEEARRAFSRALEVNSDDPEANYGLAMVFAQADDTVHAYEYLQRALKVRPEYPEALNNLGVLYLRTQRRDEAVATFQECIRIAPAFDQSYLNLARVYALEQDRTKARAVILDLLKQHPESAPAKKALEQLAQ